MYAVVVRFEIAPDRMPDFLPAVLDNARATLAEPACHRFDVATDPDRPDEVFLYELYDDAAGHAAHRQTAHYRTFAALTGDMVRHKDVRTYARIHV
ncbi:putative quinol monooxygenase [Jannaschia sp. LMIT008]|uniref:putative quinol monooxygenase n=1 Tax=Jannaschia maritima TaxID=3032585 RepID=UPI002811CA9A|nr:putative quinol monooxygenase [Jannaschia sp. LMIT008]